MPPPTSFRQHRASDASTASQQMFPHNDFVMVTPRTEGNTWPEVHSMENFHDQPLLPTPDTSHLVTPDRRTDWLNGTLGTNDFPTMPSMSGLPGILDTDTFPEFLTLPNEDDWSRWHNGPEVSHDLDGMQFDRFS
jgi:hypothetical protein